MNNERRKKLNLALSYMIQAKAFIERVRDGEQDAFDNLPDGLQCSRKGEQIEENVDTIEDILENIDEVIDGLKDII